jgi:mono/diheme cytochrome c family protein
MNSKLVGFIVATITVGAIATIAQAQGGSAAQGGKNEYQTHCAVCHGLSGKGDGIFADQLIRYGCAQPH